MRNGGDEAGRRARTTCSGEANGRREADDRQVRLRNRNCFSSTRRGTGASRSSKPTTAHTRAKPLKRWIRPSATISGTRCASTKTMSRKTSPAGHFRWPGLSLGGAARLGAGGRQSAFILRRQRFRGFPQPLRVPGLAQRRGLRPEPHRRCPVRAHPGRSSGL